MRNSKEFAIVVDVRDPLYFAEIGELLMSSGSAVGDTRLVEFESGQSLPYRDERRFGIPGVFVFPAVEREAAERLAVGLREHQEELGALALSIGHEEHRLSLEADDRAHRQYLSILDNIMAGERQLAHA